MSQKTLDVLKEDYLKHIQRFMSEAGNLFPHLTVFAESKEDNKPSIIHVPIPDDFLNDDESKDLFIDEIAPDMMIEIKKKFYPLGIAWASEAWVRTMDKNATEDDLKNYRDLPIKKEVVIVTIESKDQQQCIVYDIIRKGMKVNDEGDLSDIVELVEDINLKDMAPSTTGRFVGLYKKLNL